MWLGAQQLVLPEEQLICFTAVLKSLPEEPHCLTLWLFLQIERNEFVHKDQRGTGKSKSEPDAGQNQDRWSALEGLGEQMQK